MRKKVELQPLGEKIPRGQVEKLGDLLIGFSQRGDRFFDFRWKFTARRFAFVVSGGIVSPRRDYEF
ncbi:MAG: hypothetical protein A2583_04180 [Bdellovibrionales bacterium RIFOXYD1_FULL_53_11]|nr:MAG: hypothetical protein A2583_04180 [Bdellovibrionales bacterium RIFOXYD1_FULL_53_11]